MNIGVDIDGVISDFTSEYVRVINERYTNITLKDTNIREHDLYKVIGVPPDEAFECIEETIGRDLSIQKGAVRGLTELIDKHRINIITARGREFYDVTKDWLTRKEIPYNKLYFSDEGSKGELGKLDVLIDDNMKEITNNIGRVEHLMVFDHPWNKALNPKNYFTRVYNWDDIVEEVRKIEGT